MSLAILTDVGKGKISSISFLGDTKLYYKLQSHKHVYQWMQRNDFLSHCKNINYLQNSVKTTYL